MMTDAKIIADYKIPGERRRTVALSIVVLLCFVSVVCLSRWMDAHRPSLDARIQEEQLYLTGKTLKRMSLGFNGFVADWYWMRSLQYVGNKILTHPGEIQMDDLGPLDMRLLYPLLDATTTLDPNFMAPYQYGAVILPAINEENAIKLIRKGIAANPDNWRLYQHLGYIYWKRGDYKQASDTYATGGNIAGSPYWMREMSARMSGEGGARDVARDIYKHLYEQMDDASMKELMVRRLMQVDSFDERDAIRVVLKSFREKAARCANSWREISAELKAVRVAGGKALRFDNNGAPLDPSDTPYVLKTDECEVVVSLQSRVPYQ